MHIYREGVEWGRIWREDEFDGNELIVSSITLVGDSVEGKVKDGRRQLLSPDLRLQKNKKIKNTNKILKKKVKVGSMSINRPIFFPTTLKLRQGQHTN